MSSLTKVILPVLLDAPKTRAEVASRVGKPVPAGHITALIKEGVLAPRSVVQTGKRGRPAYVLALTDKGRKRAKRLAV